MNIRIGETFNLRQSGGWLKIANGRYPIKNDNIRNCIDAASQAAEPMFKRGPIILPESPTPTSLARIGMQDFVEDAALTLTTVEGIKNTRNEPPIDLFMLRYGSNTFTRDLSELAAYLEHDMGLGFLAMLARHYGDQIALGFSLNMNGQLLSTAGMNSDWHNQFGYVFREYGNALEWKAHWMDLWESLPATGLHFIFFIQASQVENVIMALNMQSRGNQMTTTGLMNWIPVSNA